MEPVDKTSDEEYTFQLFSATLQLLKTALQELAQGFIPLRRDESDDERFVFLV
jgi:hypothetical protein